MSLDLDKKKRLNRMVEMRKSGASYTEIGQRFGVTRQRIQQFMKAQVPEWSDLKPYREPPIKFPIPHFMRRMYRWLAYAGYLHCIHTCGLWKCSDEFGTLQTAYSGHCRKCGSEYNAAYRRTHPLARDRELQYNRRYCLKCRRVFPDAQAKQQHLKAGHAS